MRTPNKLFAKNMIKKFILLSALYLTLFVSTCFAADQRFNEHETGHAHHHNMIEVFMGGTYEDGEHGSENGFSVGLVFERRLNEFMGVGIFGEYTGGDFDMWVVGVPLFIHPYKGLRFLLAPGNEHKDHEDEFLFRAGIGYEFEVSEQWVIVPELNVDFVDGEEVYVYGVSFGYGF